MRRLVATALLIAALPEVAAAQTGGTAAPDPESETASTTPPAPKPEERGAPAPAGGDTGIFKGIEFSIETTDTQTQATMLVGDSRSRLRRDGKGKVGSNWLVRFTTPIPDTDALTKGTNLDLLSSGSKLTFSYSFFTFESAGRSLSGGPFLMTVWKPAVEACQAEAENESEREACTTHSDGSPQMPDPDYAKRYLDDGRVNRSLYPHGMMRGGLEGSIGIDQFRFVDPATLSAFEPDKTQYSGAAFFSYYPSDMRSIGTVRVEYQNGYKAGDEQQVCKPVVVDPTTDCVTGRLAPAHVERLNLSAEYRRMIEIDSNYGQFAIAPKATYDALSGEYTAQFPIYFVPQKAGPFAPGVSFNYSSTTKKFDTVVFVKGSFAF